MYNALAAIAVSTNFGIDMSRVRQALLDFKGPRMRMEYMNTNGIDIINDAYNSNPFSLKSAVEAFSELKVKGRKIMVSGDMLELGKKGRLYHNLAGRLIADSSIDALITVGDLSRYTVESARRAGMKRGSLWPCSDVKEAAAVLRRITRRGDAVLLKGSRAIGVERVARKLKPIT